MKSKENKNLTTNHKEKKMKPKANRKEMAGTARTDTTTKKINKKVALADLDLSEQVPGQPPNFTRSPQNPEHADLHDWPDAGNFAKVYRFVSDDPGEILGNVALEEKVKAITCQRENINPHEIAEKKAFLKELTLLTREYTDTVNLSEAISMGVITKYHVRLGHLFNMQKKLMPRKEWEDFYYHHFDPDQYQSVQNWMKIAAVPNSIRYAALGETRLLEIIRAIKNHPSETDDPIGDFMKKNQLYINLNNAASFKDVEIDIDVIIAKQKIDDAAALNQVNIHIDTKLLRKLIRKGKKIDAGLLKTLVVIQKSAGDPNQLLRDFYETGQLSPISLPSGKTVPGVPKLISQIKTINDYFKKNQDHIDKISSKDIEVMETQIARLKAMTGR